MKQLSDQPERHSAIGASPTFEPILDLPVDPGFVSDRPKMSADEMYQFNAAQRKHRKTLPEEWLRQPKCDVPFEL